MAKVILKKIIYYFSQCKDILKKIGNSDYFWSWKTKRLSDETIKPRTASDNSIAPAISYPSSKTRLTLTGGCLKVVNI